jgi:hypothetical protein
LPLRCWQRCHLFSAALLTMRPLSTFTDCD